MAAQVGVGEIILGVQILNTIIESFVEPYTNVPEEIVLLIRTSRGLHSMLTESENLLRSCNRAYHGQRNFFRRLNETDAFIERYQVAHTFEESKARNIHAGLKFEMQKLIQFLFLLGL
jgi:hypothetical protein